MASFCPKCGSAVPAGAGYCASCGTSIASTSAPGEPVPAAGYAPVNTQPGVAAGQYMPVAAPAPNTGPVPAKSGGGLKVVLIIVAIVAGIGAIAVGIVGYGVYRVVHDSTHSQEHEVTCVYGKKFPPCRGCRHPRFVLVRAAHHIDTHEHFK